MEGSDDSWCRVRTVTVVGRVMGQMVSHRGVPGFDFGLFHQGFVVEKFALGL